ncbi:hypothetical protein L1887_56585 [Cichorium endivia]|nr:hypothetical protein L1887_56585 [Cichorium endivia]
MDPDRVWAGRTHPPPLAPHRLLGLGTDEDPGRNDLVILDEDLISKLCTASVLSEYNALLAPDILHRVLIAVKSKHPDMSGIANIDDKVISKRAKLAQHLANDEPEDLLVRHVVCEYCHRGHRASSYLDLWRCDSILSVRLPRPIHCAAATKVAHSPRPAIESLSDVATPDPSLRIKPKTRACQPFQISTHGQSWAIEMLLCSIGSIGLEVPGLSSDPLLNAKAAIQMRAGERLRWSRSAGARVARRLLTCWDADVEDDDTAFIRIFFLPAGLLRHDSALNVGGAARLQKVLLRVAAPGDIAGGMRDYLRGHRGRITNSFLLPRLQSARPGLCTVSLLCEFASGAARCDFGPGTRHSTIVVIRGKREQIRREGEASEKRAFRKSSGRTAYSHAR